MALKKKAKLPTWEEVHEMDEEELGEFAEEHDVDLSKKEFDDIEDAQNYVCKKLGIEEEEEAEGEEPAKKKKLAFGKKKAEEEEEEDAELPSWEEVHDMSEKQLNKLIADHEIEDEVDGDFESLEEAADAVCEALGIEEPKKGKKPAKGKKVEEEEEEEAELPSWEEVHAMDEDELTELAQEHEIDLDQEFDDLEAAADYVCEQLEIEAPAKAKPAKGKLKLGSKKKK